MGTLNIILCHWYFHNWKWFFLKKIQKQFGSITQTQLWNNPHRNRLAFHFHWGISLIKIMAASWQHLILRVLTLTANSITRFQIRDSDSTHHSSSVLRCHSQSQPSTCSLIFNVKVGKEIVCTSVKSQKMFFPYYTIRTNRCFNKKKLLLISQCWFVGSNYSHDVTFLLIPVMVNCVFQLDWAIGHQDIWLNAILGVRAFLDEGDIWIRGSRWKGLLFEMCLGFTSSQRPEYIKKVQSERTPYLTALS